MKTLKIQALASAAGDDYTIAKGGVYDLPEQIALDLVKGGLAKLVEVRETGTDKQAATRETGMKK